MLVSDFDFSLPENLIAQEALKDRAASRLLVMNRQNNKLVDSRIKNLRDFLLPGDLLVINNSKVIKARLFGKRGMGKVECFLLKEIEDRTWEILINPGKKIKPNDLIVCSKDKDQIEIKIRERTKDDTFIAELSTNNKTLEEAIANIGHVPLPPYIKRPNDAVDSLRYQTVYAKNPGSVAAPTAGLHFTDDLFYELESIGVKKVEITLHVGFGTFKPVRAEVVEDHSVDPEAYEISDSAAKAINLAKQEGRRVIAIGTTTTRVLEFVGDASGRIRPGTGVASNYVYPGYKFRIVDGLLTNFHLPKSSLLMLVSAFAGKDRILRAYRHAIDEQYRFYSYGDAMLII